MLHRTEGVVLRTVQYGEADLIVTFLTKDYGIVRVFAKSPRKTKSRFGASLEPLTYSRISFWGKEYASLPRLTQADIFRVFHSIRESFHTFIKISSLVEFTLHIVPERDTSLCVYQLFRDMLEFMDNGGNWQIGGLYYRLKLLEAGGFLPNLRSCGKCGRVGGQFYLSHGTVLCRVCSSDEGKTAVNLSPAVVSLFSTMIRWDYSNIEKLRPAAHILEELILLTDEHIKFITGKNSTPVIV